MKHQLSWQRVPRDAVAEHLREVDVLASEAIGEAAIYHCRGKGGDSIAIALPGDTGLIVTQRASVLPSLERRRPPSGTPDGPAE